MKRISPEVSSSCTSASSSNARELDEQGQAHPGIHKRRIWNLAIEPSWQPSLGPSGNPLISRPMTQVDL
ncbi:hypothetical protein TNCV_1277301 [Trichonephila clavipes]|nr:hypothetical protein TNCV_1277301 [Trichonephila clavipes]